MGAIAVIRLSGKGCIEICDRIFVSPSYKKLVDVLPNTIHFGKIVNKEELIDEVLISVFHAPHSFTGEDSIEISCHGSVYIQQRILQLLISSGARLAAPGEFTQRAFLNGKMDLSQAEAVADLIASSSAAAHKMALSQMRGGFSDELMKLRMELLHITSLLELELDFSEEDVEFADRSELRSIAIGIDTLISRLCASFSLGNVIKNGIPVAIVGNTNNHPAKEIPGFYANAAMTVSCGFNRFNGVHQHIDQHMLHAVCIHHNRRVILCTVLRMPMQMDGIRKMQLRNRVGNNADNVFLLTLRFNAANGIQYLCCTLKRSSNQLMQPCSFRHFG